MRPRAAGAHHADRIQARHRGVRPQGTHPPGRAGRAGRLRLRRDERPLSPVGGGAGAQRLHLEPAVGDRDEDRADQAGHRGDLPVDALPPGDHRPGGGDAGDHLRRAVHPRGRRGERLNEHVTGGASRPGRAARAAARGAGDHPAAVVGRLPLLRRQAPAAGGRPGLRPAGAAAGDRGGGAAAPRRPGSRPTWATACSPSSRTASWSATGTRWAAAAPFTGRCRWPGRRTRTARCRRCWRRTPSPRRLEAHGRAAQPGQLRGLHPVRHGGQGPGRSSPAAPTRSGTWPWPSSSPTPASTTWSR